MTRFGGFVLCVAILVGLTVIFLSDVASLRGLGEATTPFREMLWSNRAVDLIGQMLAILAGTFGVLVLTKERIER
ncbi:MAG: hypothetical protein U9R79_16230 [Armatimonadota bacterium]|nr:hypothetical protein [Armatimonadota bacterium]